MPETFYRCGKPWSVHQEWWNWVAGADQGRPSRKGGVGTALKGGQWYLHWTDTFRKFEWSLQAMSLISLCDGRRVANPEHYSAGAASSDQIYSAEQSHRLWLVYNHLQQGRHKMERQVLVHPQPAQVRISIWIWDPCNLPINSTRDQDPRTGWQDSQDVSWWINMPDSTLQATLGKEQVSCQFASGKLVHRNLCWLCHEPSSAHYTQRCLIAHVTGICFSCKALAKCWNTQKANMAPPEWDLAPKALDMHGEADTWMHHAVLTLA